MRAFAQTTAAAGHNTTSSSSFVSVVPSPGACLRQWADPTLACGGKMSLEGNNSSSISCATFLVYFLTLASQTGCKIMNSEVAGSILTVFPLKRKKGALSCSRTCKTHSLKNNDESNTIIASHSNTEKSHWMLTWDAHRGS